MTAQRVAGLVGFAGPLAIACGLLACGGSAASKDEEVPDVPTGEDDSPAPELEPDEPLGRPVPLGGDDPCPPQPLTLADTLGSMLADVQAQPAASRPFLRYVSVGQFRRGACGEADLDEEFMDSARRELERARMAVSKVVNSMSREPSATVPAAVGPEGLLVRLDLREYGWEEPVTIDGQGYDDAWQALAARSTTALELQGGTASELSRELGTRVPVLLAGSFVVTAAQSDVYYAVLRLPATLGELKRELGIDGDEDVERGAWARAAFSNSGVSKEPRGVARYRGARLGEGSFWQTFDYAPQSRTEALYLEPLRTQANGHQVQFSLPNGMPAYFTTDGDGVRLAESLFVVDPAQNNGRTPVMSSCVSCHNAGIIDFIDEVRDFAEENADLFAEDVLARVRETFPSKNEMLALMQADSQRIVEAAARAGQPGGAPDPLSRMFLDHEARLSFDRLAAELFLDRASLVERLPRLPESIAAAAAADMLERPVFDALYLQAACALYGDAESSPVGCP